MRAGTVLEPIQRLKYSIAKFSTRMCIAHWRGSLPSQCKETRRLQFSSRENNNQKSRTLSPSSVQRERSRMAGTDGSGDPTKIMVAVNESSIKGYPHPSISCRSAFEWTLSKLVRSNFSGFKLFFLHVQVPDEDGFDDMDSIYASPSDFKSMKERDRVRGLHLLEYFVNHCHELGVSCEAWVRKGDPKEVICSEVKRVQPDMLVLGSRGLGPFQRVFVGTVSEFCVKHADCPVITIRRNANECPQDPVDD